MRRLRAAFSLFKPALSDPQFEALRQELRWFTGQLGEARNLDVLLQQRRLPRPLRKSLKKERDGAYDQVVEALDSKRLRLLLPTVPNVERLVEEGVAAWPLRPEILRGPDAKWRAFAEADAAMIASGTVSLELALAGVPMISCYRNDRIVRAIRHWITVWSAALPNIIADRPIVPEFYDDMVRPPLLARQLEALLQPGHPRDAQIEGFAEVRRRMATDRPPGEIAADAVLGLLDEKGRL